MQTRPSHVLMERGDDRQYFTPGRPGLVLRSLAIKTERLGSRGARLKPRCRLIDAVASAVRSLRK